MRRAWAWVRWFLFAAGVLFALAMGRKAVDALLPVFGKARPESKDNFRVVNGNLFVSPKGRPFNEKPVPLSPSVDPKDVIAVEIVPPARVMVEVRKKEKKDA